MTSWRKRLITGVVALAVVGIGFFASASTAKAGGYGYGFGGPRGGFGLYKGGFYGPGFYPRVAPVVGGIGFYRYAGPRYYPGRFYGRRLCRPGFYGRRFRGW